MAQSLQIFSDGDSPKPRHRLCNVYSDYANNDTSVKKHQRVIAGLGIVGMIFDVSLRLPAIFKQHFAANGMKSKPLVAAQRCSQFIFSIAHLRLRLSGVR